MVDSHLIGPTLVVVFRMIPLLRGIFWICHFITRRILMSFLVLLIAELVNLLAQENSVKFTTTFSSHRQSMSTHIVTIFSVCVFRMYTCLWLIFIAFFHINSTYRTYDALSLFSVHYVVLKKSVILFPIKCKVNLFFVLLVYCLFSPLS